MPDWPRPTVCLTKAADQASFNNVQANITGFSFPILANEEWTAMIDLSCQMVLATGVKFYFTFPAGCIGDVMRQGNIATLATWQVLQTAALTVPGAPFFLTGAINGVYRLVTRILNGATPGTIQLVGITGGATTTCVVRRGSMLTAIRISP